MIVFFWEHDFASLLFKTEKIKPSIAIALNGGFGSVDKQNPEFASFEKGYFEGGLLVKRLINSSIVGLGVGGFYRFGPYNSGDLSDDIALKFTIDFAF